MPNGSSLDNLDPDMTPENVTGYLKSKGYDGELAGRLATNVLANPYGGANYDHIKGTRQWIDSQAVASPQGTQQDRDLQKTYDRQSLLNAASKLRGTPTGAVQMGSYNAQYGQSQAPQAPQTMSVMTPQGVKIVPPMVGQWLIKNGQAQPLAASKGQPGSYLAQALPMATAMSAKWNIDPATASAITDKLLSPIKDEERNPLFRAVDAIGDGVSDGASAVKNVFTGDE